MAEELAKMESVSLSADLKRFRDLPYRHSNEALRLQTTLAVKLAETAGDFVHKLSLAEEQHSQHLLSIVKAFRKKTQESLRKDQHFTSSSYFASWEALLNQTEQQAKTCSELSQNLQKSIYQQLHELTVRKKQLMKKWFLFRESYMSRVDKTEDGVNRTFKEYQDQWTKYAEGVDKAGEEGAVKDSVVLHAYNAHNGYVMSLHAFNGLHAEFFTRQLYDMLDELQAVHDDLVRGFSTNIQKYVQVNQEKLDRSHSQFASFLTTAEAINAPGDVSAFVTGQNVVVKVYPPPRAEFRTPDLPPPKLPDAPPINLSPLDDSLQLVDMTQSPLSHAHNALKQEEFDISSSIEKLQTEYQSVKTLLDSYRENPSMGDPNSLIEDLLEIRNKIRLKESELAMTRGKLGLFVCMSPVDSPDGSKEPLSNGASPEHSLLSKPKRTSDIFVQGRQHDFADSTARIPVFCGYCDGVIQPPITKGLRCKACKMYVHHKCQIYIPYCSGQAPVKSSPKFIPKRISMMLTRKHSSELASSPTRPSKSPDSVPSHSIDEEEDETLGGIYEAPLPLPPKPYERIKDDTSPAHFPKPPPRGESLDPAKYSALEDVFVHNSFEETVELAQSYHYCVALYDYSKVNPNDMPLQAGEVIELVNTASSDWWKGNTASNKGYFPASYVQLAKRGETVMRAMYSFIPTQEGNGEMALEQGQIVVMSRNDGDGWLYGKSADQEGLFPENYVEKLSAV